MATLIQSKQIEGIVTSSVIHGEFLVSGSLTVTGSNSILGSVTASAISSSFVGDGSGLTGITYSQIDNTPQFVGGNNVTITSSSNVITVHAVLDGTGSDAQSLSISGDQLTILGGNTITIPTGSTSWEQISNIPSNIVSGSIQILGGSGVLSGSKTDISSLNTFSSSIQSEVDTLSSATSSYLTSSGSVDFSDVTSKPSGLVSSSAQITISESQISDLTHYTNTDVRTYIDSIGVVSGSYVESLPQGLISGSTFTDYSSSIETELAEVRNDLINQFNNADNALQSSITSLESYTSSIQSEVDSLTSATSSYITEIPQGTISGSQQVIDSLPTGVVSGSSQISISSSQITDLAHTQIPLGTISGSEQLPSGLVSASAQITITESQISDLSHTDISNLNTFTSSIQTEVNAISAATSSYLTEVPAGTVSGSSQISIESSQITDLAHTQIPAGTISGSEQLPQGLISGSSQITITESQISDLSHYSDSDVQTYIDSIGIVSGSVVADLPSGVVSGSQQITDSLPSGVISGSTQITISESQISDLSHTDISNLNTFTSSIQSEVDTLSSATSSYLTSIDSGIVSSSAQVTELLPTGVVSGSSQITITESQISDLTHYADSDVKTKLDTEGVLSGSLVSQLPTGIISGSEQLPSGIVSGSQQITDSLPSGVISGSEQLPSGVISGSTQITDASGLVSSSQQVIDHLPNGSISGSQQVIDSLPTGVVSGSFSGSVADAIDLLSEVSGANYLESQSVDSRLDTIEGSVGMYYDLSNTVWNNKYIKSGSNQASDTDGFLTGNVPFKFRLNTDRKLHYELNDVVYISNFDRDTTITATVSSSYETGSREIGFNVVSVNQSDDATRINDSYWVISRHTAGFVDSASYIEASSSFDQRIGVIVASGSGADWNVNLTNIPSGIVSSSEQQYTASIENGFALTSSLNNISSSLATTIENVYASSSNFDAKSLVSSSQQIDFRNVTNYVADEHIDHTTVLINAGDGLDGGGDISSTRELRLNVTSSHFEEGVKDVLTSEGVVKQSTLNTDLISTDFSQSVDTRINSISAGAVPAGTVSGSQQIDITQTQNYTSFSASIATSIDGVSASPTDISALNTFTSSTDTRITNLENFSSSLDTTFATDTELTNLSSSLSASIYDAAQSGSGVSSWNELSDIPSGLLSGSEQLPSGLLSGSEQIASDISGSFTSLSESFDTQISTEKGRIDNILSGANADYDQFVEIVNLVNSTDAENDTAFANHYTSSRQRLTSLESFTGSLDATYATDSELTNLSSSLSQSIYEAAQSGSNPIETGSFATTGSNTFKGNQIVSGSIIPEATSAGNGIHDLGSISNPFGELYITTGSVRFVRDGALVSQVSGEKDAIRVGNILITTSSLQIVSGSGDSLTTVSTIVSADVDSDGQVSNAQQLLLPDDIISGSAQITSLGFVSESFSTDGTDILSGSVDFESFSSSVDTRITNVAAGNAPAGTVSSSAQIIESLPTGVVSGSEQIEFDGNRTISNDKLGDLFTDSVNPSTTGSVIDFLNAVFYPNTGPSISTGNQTIIEYVTSGTTITTVSGTDPEGQAITFGTSSLYTDDLVRVASNGVMTLNALAESSSFNTDETGGSHGHKVEVTATDTFGTTTEKDIYIFVTPNSTPVFRETSTSGNVITSVTANLNESSTNDTLVKRVYFTDSNGDNITIYSSSIDNNHFDVTKYSTYVDIRQNTGSLDYEQQTSYTFSISASDEHYEAGQDSDSIVGLPITINVTDNLTPTVNNQTLSSINENSSNGATVGSISAADNEGNTITFVNFQLHELQLDGSTVTSGSYSGSSQLTNPHEEPFQMSTSGIVTRTSGVYLNSDLINKYIYRVQVTDPYNGESDVALITINIDDDTPATLTDNWSAGPYIKESELSGTTIKTTDYGSTSADYGSNQSGTWSSSNSAISINTNGTLSLGVSLSGSVTQSGDTIDSTITFTNIFGTTTTDSLTLDVVGNEAPTATFTNQSSVFDSNQATNGTNLVSVSISDTESDSPYQLSIGGTDASKLNAVPQNVASSSWELQASEDLVGGTYTYDVTITDAYSETTTYSSRTITIAQGDTGTLGGDTTSYIIESAESGDVLRDATGYNQGNASQLSVSYTNYGSPSVQEYTSSNEAFNIDTSGNITLGLDLSGSVTQSGETITSDITFVDQYGNIGSGSLSVSVFANNPASATFTENSSFFNTNQATGSTSLVDITSISDTESNTPYVVTLTGTHASSFSVVSQNANGTSWELQPSSDLSAGDYDYNVVITDNYSEVTTYSRSLTISQADTGTLGGDTTSYIIESSESGSTIRDASGFGAGNASQLSVSYSPNYGSQVVQSYTSSRQGISVDSSGNLTAGYDFSGSVTSTDYTSTALVSDSTNSTLYGKSLHVNGIKVVQGAATGSQSAVPDAFTEKVAQTIKLMVTSSGADINDTDQANMIGILKGETGTWHSGYPTAQRILRGAGSDYSPNPLIDSNYSSYPGLQNFQDSHATDDMIWYLNSSATSGSGDDDIVEVIEHLMHTIHQYGVRGAVSGSYNELSWDPDTDSDWNTRELYLAIEEAVDDSVFDISDYGDASYNTASTFKLIAKEYLYLLNFNMWEYSSLWDSGSLSPEWNDNSRTPSGIQTNNPLGYALYNKYIKPVLTKPSKTVLQNIFQDGDVGDPTVAGSSGYTSEVGTGLISKITFRDQYDNIGSGSVTLNVFENSAPTADFSNSGLTGNYNENLATSGTALLTSTITDTEGDTPYSMSLSGTSAWAIQAVPQNSDSSSYQIQVTDDTSSLAAGTYTYDVEVTDSFGKSTTYSNRTFEIEEADTGTLVATDTYIIESAVSGDLIRRNTDGRTGTQSSVAVSYSPSYGSPTATNFASSNALIDIDSIGRLSVGNDISGSSSVFGSIIATTITWNDQYSNNGSQVISIDVTKNFAPTVSSTSTSNLNTNQATGSELILRLNLTDTEGDTINASGLTWTGYDSTYFTPSNTTGQMNLLVNNTSVPAGEYDYTASMEDVHGFSTNLVSGSYTIAQADNGTLGGDTAIYSIESAESGDSYRDATGYNNGNTAQVSVSYSPSYGSPSVQSFTSSNPAIAVDGSGNLTLGVDISGSVTQSGDTISSTITFTDQYGNSDTGTVTATIFGNQSPAASFTSASAYDSDASISGSTAGTLTVTDTENNSPFTFTLAGTDGDKFNVAGSSSPFTVQPTGSLDAGTYSVNITITDNYSESVTLTNETIVVDAAEVLSNIYVYTLPINGTYANVSGISADGSGTPPSPTIATTYGFFTAFVDSDTLGDSTITVAYGSNFTATRRAIVSGSNVDAALDSVPLGISTEERVYVFIPSGSDTLEGVPTSFTTANPGTSTTVGEYVFFINDADSYQTAFPTDVRSANIHKLTLDTAVDGYTDWFVVGTNDRFPTEESEVYVRIVPSSGSVPS